MTAAPDERPHAHDVTTHADYRLSQLDELEAESIHIFREVAAEFEKPVLMFSGGKDSIVMLRLAEKAFYPAKIPFPVLQVDTGFDFPEVLETRDNWVNRLGVRMVIASVDEAIANGVVVDDGKTSRNRLQIGTLLHVIEEEGFTAAFGGGRRDEEKARAKERVYSHRDEFGQWDPKMQRPELWSLYNGRIHGGEHMRIFPLSNWTELDVWDYIHREEIEIPSIYFSHQRRVILRDGMLLSESEHGPAQGQRDRRGADGPLPHRRRHDPDRLRREHRLPRPPRSSRRSPSPGSPSAAPPAATTASPRRPWKTARKRATSDGPAPFRHRRLRRRRQVHPHRPAAARRQGHLRGPARGRRGHLEVPRRTTTPTSSLLTDGLRSEREQGITIDVAYRYFATPKRKFIIADTPGHVQYTRNMVTGASTADLGLVLVDARQGLTEQSRRHAVILSLLRVPHLVLAVNKMDLVDYDQAVFDKIHARVHVVRDQAQHPGPRDHPDLGAQGRQRGDPQRAHGLVRRPVAHAPPRERARRLRPRPRRHPVPGAVRRPARSPTTTTTTAATPAGVAGGVLKPGDDVLVLPSGMTSKIAGIDLFDQEIDEAFPPMSVTVRLEDDVDVSRGDMICRPQNAPKPSQDIDAMICWMTNEPLRPRQKLAIKHTTRSGRALVKDIQYRLDVNTLHRDQETKELGLNEIGRVQLRTTVPLLCDPYSKNRTTGSFILIDEATGVTVGAGMINSGS